MKYLKYLAIAAIGFIFVGCATSSTIITDYDHDVSFNQYKTYYWANEFARNSNNSKKPLFYNSLIQKRLKNAIQKQMKARGYTLNKQNPDLLVNANVLVKPNQNIKTTTTSYSPFYPGFGGYFGYYYGYYGNEQSTSTSINTNIQGGLVIELIDRAKRQLVWQGYEPNVLHTDTKNKRKELNQAVSKIFAQYDNRVNNK